MIRPFHLERSVDWLFEAEELFRTHKAHLMSLLQARSEKIYYQNLFYIQQRASPLERFRVSVAFDYDLMYSSDSRAICR